MHPVFRVTSEIKWEADFLVYYPDGKIEVVIYPDGTINEVVKRIVTAVVAKGAVRRRTTI